MGFAMVNDRYLLRQESLGWLLLIALVVLGRASAAGSLARRRAALRPDRQGDGGERPVALPHARRRDLPDKPPCLCGG
jgi:hypothetical protein